MRANEARAYDRGKNGVFAWLQLELKERRGKSFFTCEEAVMERLIERNIECKSVFSELFNGLQNYQWQNYLLVFVSTAGLWNPNSIAESRLIKKELIDLNKQIADLSGVLGILPPNVTLYS